MNITFKTTPTLFGSFHIITLLLIIIFNISFYFYFKKKNETVLLKSIFIIGIIMILMEIFKHIFCFFYVFNKEINLWFFPFQLCSMAMYLSFLIKYVNKNIQNNFLIFLSTYNLFASVVALLTPLDMLRPQILLTLQSFIYHSLMISVAILSILILKNRNNLTFKPTIYLFLLMAVIAEIINVIAHLIFNDIYREPNMFYITPVYPTTQPIFHDIAVKFGIFTEIIIYLSIITLGSYLIFLFLYKRKTNH